MKFAKRMPTPPPTATPVCAHHVPGRLRLKARSWRHNRALIEEAAGRLVTIPGVTAVSANDLTGSIVVEYEPTAVSFGALSAEMRQRGFPPVPPIVPVAMPARDDSPAGYLSELAARLLLEGMVQRLFAVMIAAAL